MRNDEFEYELTGKIDRQHIRFYLYNDGSDHAAGNFKVLISDFEDGNIYSAMIPAADFFSIRLPRTRTEIIPELYEEAISVLAAQFDEARTK